MVNTSFKWIRFDQIPYSGKTKKYRCVNKEFGSEIGIVMWYGAFRKYSFLPNPNMVFESQCLKDIASFLESLMLERKTEKELL